MKAAADDAAAKAVSAEAQAATARAAVGTSQTAYNNAVSNLYGIGDGYQQDGQSRRGKLSNAVDAYRNLAQAKLQYAAAQGQAQSARGTANQTASAAAAALADAQANPADAGKQQAAAALQARAAATAADANNAEAQAAAAATAMNNAQDAWNSARATAVNSFSFRYCTTDSKGKETCTDVDGRGPIDSALNTMTSAYDKYLVDERAANEKQRRRPAHARALPIRGMRMSPCATN